MTIRYSLDVDGVVADYSGSREKVARTLNLRPLSQPLWLEPEALDALMEERQTEVKKAVGQYITEHLEEFFVGMECIVTPEDRQAMSRAAAEGYELFWVSSRTFFGGPSHRYGKNTEPVARLTEEWLTRNGLPAADTAHVILTPSKAKTITEWDIRFHLDDAVAHVTSIALQTQAKVFLLRQPYNQRFVISNPDEPDADYETNAGAYGVQEVDSIAEYITLMVGK